MRTEDILSFSMFPGEEQHPGWEFHQEGLHVVPALPTRMNRAGFSSLLSGTTCTELVWGLSLLNANWMTGALWFLTGQRGKGLSLSSCLQELLMPFHAWKIYKQELSHQFALMNQSQNPKQIKSKRTKIKNVSTSLNKAPQLCLWTVSSSKYCFYWCVELVFLQF